MLLLIVLLLLIFSLPSWPYARTWGWGYWPGGLLGLILLILLIRLLLG